MGPFVKMLELMVALLGVFDGLARPLIDRFLNVLYVITFGKRKELPTITNPILLLSAAQLAQEIRQRKVTCVEAMRAYIDRVNEVNPFINASVDQRFDEAIKEARAADKFINSGEKSVEELARETPLLGIPFSCKEAIAVKGMFQTIGLVARKGQRAEEDAEVVKRYKLAGAIPYIVTNLPELCMWLDSSNNLYGTTKNPHDLYRTCGGSSGGEGAILGAAGAVIGIGTDVGGSIRIPAAYNCIFGHKPTPGVVSNKGVYPFIAGISNPYYVTGPMCRYAEDLLLLMKVAAGNSKKLQLNETVDFSNVKFYYMEDDSSYLNSATNDIRNAVKKAAEHFRNKFSSKITDVKFEELKQASDIWICKLNEIEQPPFTMEMANFEGNVSPKWEFFKWFFGQSKHTLPTIYFGMAGQQVKNKAYFNSLKQCKDLEVKMSELLNGNAVFLYPTQPAPAPYLHATLPKLRYVGYTGIFNVLSLPSTSIPAGLSAGLPIAIQAISGPFKDHLSIATAIELEDVFKGWVSPCPIVLREEE